MNENLDVKQKNINKRLFISTSILVFSLVIITMSVSYAYFSVSFRGTASVSNDSAAKFNVTSTLNNATAITADKMNLIEASAVTTSAKKVDFSVTNPSTSTVSAKYTLKIVSGSISKNLCSKYFKWRLVKGTSQIAEGNFAGAVSGVTEGTTTTDQASFTKELLGSSNAQTLAAGGTDNLTLYLWLENDAAANQLYLTNGSFSGKLSLEAVPVKTT